MLSSSPFFELASLQDLRKTGYQQSGLPGTLEAFAKRQSRKMKILIVGNGKLADAILSADLRLPNCVVSRWNAFSQELSEKCIVVHAGSGRQLDECLAFCSKTNSVLIELSTGLSSEYFNPDFTLIICPNTSILLLKTLFMFKQFGRHFGNYKVSISESHQSTKKSIAGTAFGFAQSLKYPTEKIHSIREEKVQLNEMGIPEEFLNRHAYHKIVIEDGSDRVIIETKVLGHSSYSAGTKKIIQAVLDHEFERRRYSVLELIDMDLL